MLKKLVVLTGAALLLAGCAGQPQSAEPSPSWTPTIDDGGPAGIACRAFATDFPKGVNNLSSDETVADWDALKARIDEIALKADGDVKTRMMELVSNWPDLADITIYGNVDEANNYLSAIERACDAAGEPINGMQLTSN